MEPPHPRLVAAAAAAAATAQAEKSQYASGYGLSHFGGMSNVDGPFITAIGGSSSEYIQKSMFTENTSKRTYNGKDPTEGSVVGLVYVPRDELLVTAFSGGSVKVRP